MNAERGDAPAVRSRPVWRGVLHQYAFFAAVAPVVISIATAPTTKATIAAAIYGGSLAALLGTSALYHRITWSPRARLWMGRLDFAMIFFLIAGSFTPIALLTLEPHLATVALWLVWGAALAGMVVKLFWTHAPKWARSVIYVVIGSVGACFAPQVSRSIGGVPMMLLVLGGAIYILGAVVYALQRPDPLPSVFGYHEIFHALVVIAAAVHFVALAVYIVPNAA